MTYQVGEFIEGTITALAFGGQGILRDGQFVIFVPYAAVGDILKVKITKRKKSFAYGEISDILVASPHRTKPRCKYYGRCNGCQLQHMDDNAQLTYKKTSIVDALKRIGNIHENVYCDIVAATLQWAYRRRICLSLKPHERTFSAGYVCRNSRDLIQITECPIFVDEKHPVLPHAQTMVRQLENSACQQGHLTLIKGNDKKFIYSLKFSELLPDNVEDVLEKEVSSQPFLQGANATSPRGSVSLGLTEATFDIEGMNIHFSPRCFVQNHPQQSERLYRYVKDLIMEVEPQSIVDLYCGIGVTTLLFAQQGIPSVGIELNKHAIIMARHNASINGLVDATLLQGDVAKVFVQATRNHQPEVVFINPPRTGLDPRTRQAITAQRPSHIIYTSCMPSTLARDVKDFITNGYAIISCKAFDLFPQTAHTETVMVLKAML